MSSLFCVTLLLLGVTLAAPKWNQLSGYTFEQYVKDFSKPYAVGTVEYSRRQKIFYATLQDIQTHNAQSDVSWRKGVNQFTDMTHEENNRLNGARPRAMRLSAAEKKHARSYVRTGAPIPAAVDYRNSLPSILTAVKDQGNCGSCWAHGSTEQMESYAALATGKLSVLSQQQVTACAPNPNQCGGTGGCGGSTAELAFEYVASAAGLTTEWFYPYTAHNGTTGQCKTGLPPSLRLEGYTQLASNDQATVLEVLASIGPLAVNVDATNWFMYESGIFTGCSYNITINHVVQLVGYGTDRTLNMDYWIVRNSWTPDYGENGYIRVHRSATPTCGWDVNPQDGTGCKGGPPQLWACGMCGILFDTSYPNVASPH